MYAGILRWCTCICIVYTYTVPTCTCAASDRPLPRLRLDLFLFFSSPSFDFNFHQPSLQPSTSNLHQPSTFIADLQTSTFLPLPAVTIIPCTVCFLLPLFRLLHCSFNHNNPILLHSLFRPFFASALCPFIRRRRLLTVPLSTNYPAVPTSATIPPSFPTVKLAPTTTPPPTQTNPIANQHRDFFYCHPFVPSHHLSLF